MTDPILDQARALLTSTQHVGKRRALGGVLRTHTGEDMPGLAAPAILSALEDGRDLTQDEQRDLIHALDVLTVALPDLDTHQFDDSIQKIAGTLRERYARRYKSSAYDR